MPRDPALEAIRQACIEKAVSEILVETESLALFRTESTSAAKPSSSQLQDYSYAHILDNAWYNNIVKTGVEFCRAYPPLGEEAAPYNFANGVIQPRLAGLFIALEEQEAADAAVKLLHTNPALLRHIHEGKAIPLIYGADSGIHTVLGFAAGLRRIEPNTRFSIVPLKSGDDAANAVGEARQLMVSIGTAIVCDSTMALGRSSSRLLEQLSSFRKPLDVIFYSNTLYAQKNNDIEALERLAENAGHHRLLLCTSKIARPDSSVTSPFDRGDIIAHADDPHTVSIRSLLLKRTPSAVDPAYKPESSKSWIKKAAADINANHNGSMIEILIRHDRATEEVRRYRAEGKFDFSPLKPIVLKQFQRPQQNPRHSNIGYRA